MKKHFWILSYFLLLSSIAAGQPGQYIAWWKFNGNTMDSSGNGLHGTGNNLTPATGMSGVPNTAYKFNGTDAYINVPFNSLMNVDKFTIGAVLKVDGWYSGFCQAEMLLQRGTAATTGSYGLLMTDNAHDSNNCNAFDSTKFVFCGYGPLVPVTSWQTTPTISKNEWIRVAVTFDSVVYKMFVNGALRVTVPCTNCLTGVNNQGITIGRNYDNIVNYPYWFNGILDDLWLYGRALEDDEAGQLGCCSNFITQHPIDSSTIPGINVTFSVATTPGGCQYLDYPVPGFHFQWQVDTGSGFVDITNTLAYAGINSATLTVLAPGLSMNNYSYRCVIIDPLGCESISMPAQLKVIPTSIGTVSADDHIIVYPVPSQKELNIASTRDVISSVKIVDMTGRSVFERSGVNAKSTTLHLNLAPAVYTLFIVSDNEHISVRRIILQ